jgi:hypothetical protein
MAWNFATMSGSAAICSIRLSLSDALVRVLGVVLVAERSTYMVLLDVRSYHIPQYMFREQVCMIEERLGST